ncbi:unnamed protein product [Cyprideis torosa]|uniref:Ribosome biogenesis protein NOP53 n=1 Tax=Cyprideis torosa TaxID=163714 RepID=A0A7R8W869_9CRUS|nr:unnamed protein product [Cyprideis torosa]CAG0883467.1 unnamed protein product [Cyprideis torosa]
MKLKNTPNAPNIRSTEYILESIDEVGTKSTGIESSAIAASNHESPTKIAGSLSPDSFDLDAEPKLSNFHRITDSEINPEFISEVDADFPIAEDAALSVVKTIDEVIVDSPDIRGSKILLGRSDIRIIGSPGQDTVGDSKESIVQLESNLPDVRSQERKTSNNLLPELAGASLDNPDQSSADFKDHLKSWEDSPSSHKRRFASDDSRLDSVSVKSSGLTRCSEKNGSNHCAHAHPLLSRTESCSSSADRFWKLRIVRPQALLRMNSSLELRRRSVALTGPEFRVTRDFRNASASALRNAWSFVQNSLRGKRKSKRNYAEEFGCVDFSEESDDADSGCSAGSFLGSSSSSPVLLDSACSASPPQPSRREWLTTVEESTATTFQEPDGGSDSPGLSSKIALESELKDGAVRLLKAASGQVQVQLQAAKSLITSNARLDSYRMASRRNCQAVTVTSASNAPVTPARITLSDVRIPLMWKGEEHFKNKGELRRFAVFLLVGIGSEIYDSALLMNIDRSVTDVCVDETFTFSSVPPNFVCDLKLYSCPVADLEGKIGAASSSGGVGTLRPSTLRAPQRIRHSLSRTLAPQRWKGNTTIASGIEDPGEIDIPFTLLAKATLSRTAIAPEITTHDLMVEGVENQQLSSRQQLPLFGHFCCRLRGSLPSPTTFSAPAILKKPASGEEAVHVNLRRGELSLQLPRNLLEGRTEARCQRAQFDEFSEVRRKSGHDQDFIEVETFAETWSLTVPREHDLDELENALKRAIEEVRTWGQHVVATDPEKQDCQVDPLMTGSQMSFRSGRRHTLYDGTLLPEMVTPIPSTILRPSESFLHWRDALVSPPPPLSPLTLGMATTDKASLAAQEKYLILSPPTQKRKKYSKNKKKNWRRSNIKEVENFLDNQRLQERHGKQQAKNEDIFILDAKELAGDPQLFISGASKGDIMQGELGDYWFLSLCAAVAREYQLIHRQAARRAVLSTTRRRQILPERRLLVRERHSLGFGACACHLRQRQEATEETAANSRQAA